MISKKYKLAIILPHPVQYHVGIWRRLESVSNLDYMAIYLDDIGLKETYQHDFKTTIKWDIDLVSGYKHKFFKNFSLNSSNGFFARLNLTLPFELMKQRYDVILIQSYTLFSYWLVFFMAKLLGIKIIFRGEAILRGNEGAKSFKIRFKQWILLKFFKACDAIMYSCAGNKGFFKFYGVPDEKLFPIPCAVDNEYFQKENEKYILKRLEIRKELGISEDDFVIIFAARFTDNKRPLDLINAISRIENKNITMLFVGDGSLKLQMQKLSKELGIKSIFVGFINQGQISKYYAIASLFVIISDYDTSPKAMNEAMNFRLPLICTNRAGTAYDLVKDGINGFLVETGNIEMIATKIDYLNKNRDIAKEMGQKSVEIVNGWSFDKDAYWVEKAVGFVMDSK